jgi:hypothetical protein
MVDLVDMVQLARNCPRKTLLSLCRMRPCIVRRHDNPSFTSVSTPSNDLDENISDIVVFFAMNLALSGFCQAIDFISASSLTGYEAPQRVSVVEERNLEQDRIVGFQ